MAHLKRQHARVGDLIETARWRSPGIHDCEAPAGLQPIEAGLGRLCRCAPLGLGPRQNQVDQNPVVLKRVVEQREAAIAVPEKTQYRRHSLDRVLQPARCLDLCRPQHGARVDQILQNLKLQRGITRQVISSAATMARKRESPKK